MKKRIGILTGGGDCPGLNAVIRAVTKGAIKKGCEVLGFKDGYKGLVEKDYVALSEKDVSNILTVGGTILGTSNIANPYKWAYKSKGKLRFKDVSKKAIENFKRLKLQGLIVIGGDGSMAIANRLYKDGIPVIGVPKTIDNDLNGTDVTFGFNTAVTTATEAIDKIHTTAQSHNRVMVVEVMGRYAGWIALYSGIAGGGDIILLPEIPFQTKYICKKIQERRARGKTYTIIVVSEGARAKGEKLTVKKIVKNSTDPIRLGGIAHKVAHDIERKLGIEARAIVLGHVQRGGVPTPSDRLLATRFGIRAIEKLIKKEFGQMVSYENDVISSASLEEVAKCQKLISKEYHLLEAARLVGTSFGDK